MNNSANRIAGANAKTMGVAAGVSDLELILPNGMVAFIELKLPGKTQSDVQKEFQSQLIERGHLYFLVYTLEEFKKLVIKLLSNG